MHACMFFLNENGLVLRLYYLPSMVIVLIMMSLNTTFFSVCPNLPANDAASTVAVPMMVLTGLIAALASLF